MKRNFFILFIFCWSYSFSQGWAPTGATWHYTQISFSGPLVTFSTVQSIGDTVILGIPCKKISGGGCGYYGPEFFIYSDSGKVFFYEAYYSRFELLYDFTALQGDQWIVHPYSQGTLSDSIIVNVDSTGTQIINSDTLKVLYTSASSSPTFGIWDWGGGGKMIDKIGSMYYFVPQAGFCDPPTFPLRCYDDSIIGHYETGVASSCQWTNVGINEYYFQNSLSLFPNPSYGIFTVSASANMKSIEIFDVLGNIIISQTVNSQQVTVNLSFTNGIYFVKVLDVNGNSTMKKMIIE